MVVHSLILDPILAGLIFTRFEGSTSFQLLFLLLLLLLLTSISDKYDEYYLPFTFLE